MILAVDITDGYDLSNENCHKLLPKKSNGIAVFGI